MGDVHVLDHHFLTNFYSISLADLFLKTVVFTDIERVSLIALTLYSGKDKANSSKWGISLSLVKSSPILLI
jgi:hypothetical protein